MKNIIEFGNKIIKLLRSGYPNKRKEIIEKINKFEKRKKKNDTT